MFQYQQTTAKICLSTQCIIVRRVDSIRTFRLFMVIKEREDHQKEHVFTNKTYCQNALLPQMSLLDLGFSIKCIALS